MGLRVASLSSVDLQKSAVKCHELPTAAHGPVVSSLCSIPLHFYFRLPLSQVAQKKTKGLYYSST